MCTAITYKTKDHYFGRTLDLEYSYNEKVVVAPRNFVFPFRTKAALERHYSIMGIASVVDDYPLFYEAVNEYGLFAAGLNFPENAYYFPLIEGKDNISPFEFIPWILCQCKDLLQVRHLLKNINLCRIDFSEKLPLSPLHWMIADREGAITVESVAEGLKIYDNPIGVLTNNPTFDYHMLHLSDYKNVTALEAENRFGNVELPCYSRGMGGIGLPGDLSSASRFVRAAFMKLNAISGESEDESVSQFFHILGAVAHPRGSVRFRDGSCEITVYTSCINADKGIFYYTTYENQCISAVDMNHCNLEDRHLFCYPLIAKQQILRQN